MDKELLRDFIVIAFTLENMALIFVGLVVALRRWGE